MRLRKTQEEKLFLGDRSTVLMESESTKTSEQDHPAAKEGFEREVRKTQ